MAKPEPAFSISTSEFSILVLMRTLCSRMIRLANRKNVAKHCNNVYIKQTKMTKSNRYKIVVRCI